jgi:citrate lyase subunit beta/citryl-CoA lyase
VIRSWLYVPADRPDRIPKALAAGGDAVVLDLEDAVPVGAKDDARAHAIAALRDLPAQRPQVWVRINAPGTPAGQADISALSGTAVDGVRIPRAEDPEEVTRAAEALGCPVQLVVESAVGLLAARELAAAHPGVVGIGLGEADLAADLRSGPGGLDWARGWIVVVARGTGLPAPVQSVYTDVTDLDGLRRTTAIAREQGFFGRSVVHPRQIAPVHEAVRPSAAETAAAQQVVDAFDAARARGARLRRDDQLRLAQPAGSHHEPRSRSAPLRFPRDLHMTYDERTAV